MIEQLKIRVSQVGPITKDASGDEQALVQFQVILSGAQPSGTMMEPSGSGKQFTLTLPLTPEVSESLGKYFEAGPFTETEA